MIDLKFIDDIAKKLTTALPANFHEFEKDLQLKFREILQSVFAKLDLITREEFDAQSKVLTRTRHKLEELTKKVDELESHYEQQKKHQTPKKKNKD